MQVESIDTLEAEARRVTAKIEKIKEAERFERNKGLEGKAFKYRNCYSCPEKPSDYWWLYIKVLKVTKDHIETHQFQTDKYGEITITLRKRHYRNLFGADSRIEIKPAEFTKAWKAVQAKIKAQ